MPVHLERHGRVGVITIDRPAKRNAIDTDTAAGLSAALDSLEADPEIWCGVLTGAGGFFSAGTDLTEPASPRAEAGGEYGIIRRTRSKPLIAAVEGFALGGGFEIVLACDLVVAGEQSRFGLPEVGIGVIATCAGLFRAPRALPLNVARELALCGKPLGAARMYELGLVNRVVTDGSTLPAAIELAGEICDNSPISVSETLKAINGYVGLDDDAGWQLTDRAIGAIAVSPDREEGRAAFFDRRPPEWVGLHREESDGDGAPVGVDGDTIGPQPSADSYLVALGVLAAYCGSLDQRSPQDLRRLLHDGVTLELATGTHAGADAAMDSYEGFFAAADRTTRHHVTNVWIIDESHDRIEVEAYLLAVTEKDGNVSIASGTYHIDLVKVGETWLIARNRIDLDVSFVRVAERAPAPPGT